MQCSQGNGFKLTINTNVIADLGLGNAHCFWNKPQSSPEETKELCRNHLGFPIALSPEAEAGDK